MDPPAPPVPLDSRTEALLRVRGQDPHDLQALFGRILHYIHYVLPDPPVSRRATLRARRPHDDVDRVSSLPHTILRDIVSRLPAKDAARTAVLATRWRGLFRSAPLVLVDSHLPPPASASASGDQVERAEARRVTSAVSRILVAHPGPFRCVHLTCSYMGEFPSLLVRWLHTLAAKGVQDLVLVNRPFPLALDLPATFFSMPALTRLYLGFFKFPDTAALPRTASFPSLRELGLCSVVIFGRDMDFVLARSPALEILCIQANFLTERLRLVSRSLRCVQLISATDLDILVEDAPHLERLIVWSASTHKRSILRIKISHAPALSLLGYLEPEFYELEVGNTVIKTRASPTTMVPTVKIVGLRVRFGIRKYVKLLPAFLRCFPNVERLHVECKGTAEPTGKLNLKFWKEAGAIECVQSHIKLMIFHNFHGDRSELSFLKYFLESVQMLTKLVILFPKGTFTSLAEANSKLEPLFAAKWANTCCALLLFEGAYAEGKEPLRLCNFKGGSNFSARDPLSFIVRA
ncbi:unnamed protein product [Alopecurus aequalis]